MTALLSLLLLGHAPAHATVTDAFGAGGEQIAQGGGGVASVDDGAAALSNPAGLHRIRRPTAAFGLSWARYYLADPPPVYWDTNRDGTIDGDDPPLELTAGVDDAWGVHASVGRHVGGRFGLGLAAYIPAQRLFRLKTFEPSLPTHIRYDNRPQRYVLAAGVGGEVVPGVSLGASLDIVPRVRFTVGMTADIRVEGDDQAEDLGDLVGDAVIDVHEITLDVIPGVAPVVGLQLDAGRWSPKLEGLQLGATWRGEVGVPILADLDIQANVTAADLGELDPFSLAGVIDAELFLFDHYVPMKVDVGLAYTYAPWVSAYVDARWTDWRGLTLSVATLEDADVTLPLFDIDDAVRDGNAYDLTMRSVWSVRTGASMNLPRFEFDNRLRYLQLTTRAGFGYEPTPLVSQGRTTSFLDASRWWLAGGLGAEFWDPLDLIHGPISVQGYFQYHRMVPAFLPKPGEAFEQGFPVSAPGFDADGFIVVLGAEVGFQY